MIGCRIAGQNGKKGEMTMSTGYVVNGQEVTAKQFQEAIKSNNKALPYLDISNIRMSKDIIAMRNKKIKPQPIKVIT